MDDLIERLEAERDRMWAECRLLTIRTYTTATPDILGQAAAELRTLRAERDAAAARPPRVDQPHDRLPPPARDTEGQAMTNKDLAALKGRV